MDAETVMRAAAHGVLIALAFLWAGRVLLSLRHVPKDTEPTKLQSAGVALMALVFAYSGWWLFGEIISGLLAFR